MDIFEHLKHDHRAMSELMNRIMTTQDVTERGELFSRFREEVIAHSQAEEANFYSVLAHHEELEDLILEAREDHRMIEAMLREFDGLAMTSGAWMDRFEELKESLDDHVDQEETEIFDEAKSILDDHTATELEQRMTRDASGALNPT